MKKKFKQLKEAYNMKKYMLKNQVKVAGQMQNVLSFVKFLNKDMKQCIDKLQDYLESKAMSYKDKDQFSEDYKLLLEHFEDMVRIYKALFLEKNEIIINMKEKNNNTYEGRML